MRSANFPRSSAKYSKLESWRVAASASFWRKRCERQCLLVAKALGGASPAPAIAGHSRRGCEERGTQFEEEMNLFSGPPSDRDFHRSWRRISDASVELAAVDSVRMAAGYLQAGYRIAGSLPDSVRTLGRRVWPRSLQIAAVNRGMLGAHDARGARESPPKNALTVRCLRSFNQGNQRVGKFLLIGLLAERRWRNGD